MFPNLSPCIRYPVHHYNLKYTAIWEGVEEIRRLQSGEKYGEGGGFTIALFFSVSSNIPIAMAEKDIWPEKKKKEKNTEGAGGGGNTEKAFKLRI